MTTLKMIQKMRNLIKRRMISKRKDITRKIHRDIQVNSFEFILMKSYSQGCESVIDLIRIQPTIKKTGPNPILKYGSRPDKKINKSLDE